MTAEDRPPIIMPAECHYRALDHLPNARLMRGAVISRIYQEITSDPAKAYDSDPGTDFSAAEKIAINGCATCILTLCPDFRYTKAKPKSPIGQIVEVQEILKGN